MMIDPEVDQLVRLGQRVFLLEGVKNGFPYLFTAGIGLSGGRRKATLFRQTKVEPSYYNGAGIELVGWDLNAEFNEPDASWYDVVTTNFMLCEPPLSVVAICDFLGLDSVEWRYSEVQIRECLDRYPNVTQKNRDWVLNSIHGGYEVVGVSEKVTHNRPVLFVAIAASSQPSPGWKWSPEEIPLESLDRMRYSLVFHNFQLKDSLFQTGYGESIDLLQQAVQQRAEESRVEWFARMHDYFDVSDAGILEEIVR